jgi:phosphatidylethanolamine/phosphatidyl-N-methylethanolamine N-methyltransferase
MAMFVITVVPHPDRVLAEMARCVPPRRDGAARQSLLRREGAARAAIERHMARFAKLGWRPDFPIETVLGRPELRLVERRPVKAMDLFTMLRFERL